MLRALDKLVNREEREMLKLLLLLRWPLAGRARFARAGLELSCCWSCVDVELAL